jgi:hypothetical protein
MSTPSISNHAPNLELLNSFLGAVEQYHAANPDIHSGRYIQVLTIYRWHLLRAKQQKAATLDELPTLKHGVRTAEIILHAIRDLEPEAFEDFYFGCNPQNQPQRFANSLWTIIMSLTMEIQENEHLYPELKDAFDRERAEYRRIKLEAEEAMSLD